MRFALLIATLLALPLAAQAQIPASQKPYLAELRRQCPQRHLEQMTAGDLGLIMEGFHDRLSKPQQHEVEDMVGRRCALVEGGLTCANNASLVAYGRLGVLKAFVRQACASGWTCHGEANCTQAPTPP